MIGFKTQPIYVGARPYELEVPQVTKELLGGEPDVRGSLRFNLVDNETKQSIGAGIFGGKSCTRLFKGEDWFCEDLADYPIIFNNPDETHAYEIIKAIPIQESFGYTPDNEGGLLDHYFEIEEIYPPYGYEKYHGKIRIVGGPLGFGMRAILILIEMRMIFQK